MNGKPIVVTAALVKALDVSRFEPHQRDATVKWAKRMASGRPFFESGEGHYTDRHVHNVSISRPPRGYRQLPGRSHHTPQFAHQAFHIWHEEPPPPNSSRREQ